MHRDIKPENFLFSIKENTELKDSYLPSENVMKLVDIKICDFGLSKAVGDRGSMLASMGMGTPFMMPPEHLEQIEITNKEATKSDVWSYGALAYYLFTGHFPFEKETISDVIDSVKEGFWYIKKDWPVSLEFLFFLESCLQSKIKNRLSMRSLVKHEFLQ